MSEHSLSQIKLENVLIIPLHGQKTSLVSGQLSGPWPANTALPGQHTYRAHSSHVLLSCHVVSTATLYEGARCRLLVCIHWLITLGKYGVASS